MVHDNQRWICLIHNGFDLTRAQPGIQPSGDGADHRRGRVTRRVVDARRQPQCDYITLTDSGGGELQCDCAGPTHPIGERDSTAGLHIGFPVTVNGGGSLEQRPSVTAVWVKRRSRHYGSSPPRIIVPLEQNQPPVALTQAIFASGTCRGPHSPRSWRTASTKRNKPR